MKFGSSVECQKVVSDTDREPKGRKDTMENGKITLFANLQLNLRLCVFVFLQILHDLN